MTDRYSRQALFPHIGGVGQEKIQQGSILVVGCGALGSVSAEMLVRAGAGKVRIVDRDTVEESNLHRQSLFDESHVQESLPKAAAAEQVLHRINSSVKVEGITADLNFENIGNLASCADLIVDGTDNYETRFLMNDYSLNRGIPWIYGAALGSYGTSFPIIPGRTACLRCLFNSPPPAGAAETCETAGILSPVIHAVSAFQVSQVLKYLTGGSLDPHILQVDIWKDRWRTLPLAGAAEDCVGCRGEDYPFLSGSKRVFTTTLCGRNAIHINPGRGEGIDLSKLAERLERRGSVQSNTYVLRFSSNQHEITVFPDGRAIIKGTDDISRARALYARYIGN